MILVYPMFHVIMSHECPPKHQIAEKSDPSFPNFQTSTPDPETANPSHIAPGPMDRCPTEPCHIAETAFTRHG